MIEKILSKKIIAIIRAVSKNDIVNLASALNRGGINSMEIAIDHTNIDTINSSIESIKILKDGLGDMINVGAGTVLTKEEVLMAKNAGATFIISPNMSEEVIKKTKELSLISMPGAYTATEVVNAINYGADIIKIFPAANAGASYFKNLLSPLKGIKLMAVGGVNLDNAKSFLEAGAVGLGIGGNLVDKKLIANGDFDAITNIAKKYIEVVG